SSPPTSAAGRTSPAKTASRTAARTAVCSTTAATTAVTIGAAPSPAPAMTTPATTARVTMEVTTDDTPAPRTRCAHPGRRAGGGPDARGPGPGRRHEAHGEADRDEGLSGRERQGVLQARVRTA